MFFLAITFVLEVDFLAVSQVMIYVGGVLVIILFGIMLIYRVDHIKEMVISTSAYYC